MPKKPTVLLTLTLLLGGGTYQTIQTLEHRYPPRPAKESTSLALRTPQNPASQHCRYVDVFSARIPLRYLLSRSQSRSGGEVDPSSSYSTSISKEGEGEGELQETWARSIIGTSILRAEGSLVRFLCTWRSFEPGDVGASDDGFAPYRKSGNRRMLLNGLLAVERVPSSSSSSSLAAVSAPAPTTPTGGSANEYTPENGLLVSWQMAPQACRFFETLARWGYPWRLMSGGRHEMSVSEPFDSGAGAGAGNDGEGPYVEVWFSSAHDYETIAEEGEIEEQKCVPRFTRWLHRAFARAVLDMAVRELRWEDERREKGLG